MVSSLMTGGRGTSNANRPSRKPRKGASPSHRHDRSDDSANSGASDHEPQKERRKREAVQSVVKVKPRVQRSPRHPSKEKSSSRDQPNEKKNSNGLRRDSKVVKTGDVSGRDRAARDSKRSIEGNERHPLFQDSSRLSQLIGQVTSSQDDVQRRLAGAQALYEYIYEPAHLEPVKRNCSQMFTALEEVLKERGHNELKDRVIQCYGSIGNILGIDCEKYFQWVFSSIPSAANDQLRVLYLRTIAEAIRLDVGKQVFYETMPMIMASLQDVLENADAPELLFVILELLTIVAHDYPSIFAEYFRDTVDILVGWHIDATQEEKLIERTADCLVSFHAYWVSDMRFSLTLLGQFLEDMEAYSEELNSINLGEYSKEDTPSVYVSLPKLMALTRVFTTVVRSLGEYFSPGREPKITVSYINETLSRIVKCVDICGYALKYEKLLIAANDCLLVLVGSLGHNTAANTLQLVKFLNRQLEKDHSVSYQLLNSALALYDAIVNSVGTSLPGDVIPLLLEPQRPLMKLRSHAEPEILKLLLKIIQNLMSVKNISLLEAVYKLIVADLKQSYLMLKMSISSKSEMVERNSAPAEAAVSSLGCKTDGANLRNSGPHDQPAGQQGEVSFPEALNIIAFDLAAVAEIATYKSSIAGAWQVDPPTFQLLTKDLDPLDDAIAVHYPCIQFAILSTLFTHSQRCNHFIPTAKSKAGGQSKESVDLLQLLCCVLIQPTTVVDVKRLVLVWLTDIASSIAALPMDIQKRQWNMAQVVEAMIIASYDIEQSLQEELTNCVSTVSRTGLVHPVVLSRVLAECLPHLTDVRPELFKKYKKMILSFPADMLASLPTATSQSSKLKQLGANESYFAVCERDLWVARKIHMCRQPTGTLHSFAFKVIMGHILRGQQDRVESCWLKNLFSMCQRVGKVADPFTGDISSLQRFTSSVDSAFPINVSNLESILWFWATWECAEFCLLSRLKTPLGKALDTFQTVEGVLKELTFKFKDRSYPEQNLGFAKMKEASQKKGDDEDAEPDAQDITLVNQAVLLLQFLEQLEKLMYNAYEGSATAIPPAIRSVRTFFRTNRSTCQEWLVRIRESVTILATLCGSPEAAVRNGFQWLKHLKDTGNTQGSDFEHAIITVVDALCQLHCHESIQGILDWTYRAVGRNFFWLHGAPVKARGSLESAADLFKAGIDQYLSPDRLKSENILMQKKSTVTVLTKDPVIHSDIMSTQFLVSQVADCYLQLCDWTEVQQWNKRVAELRRKFPSVNGLNATVDHNYVKAMMKFEEHDFAGVHEQLELIPGATMSNIMQEQFPVLGATKEERDSKLSKRDEEPNCLSLLSENYNPHSLLCQSRLCLMQALTLYWTSGLNTLKGSRVGSLHSTAWEAVDKLLGKAADAAFVPLRSVLLNGSSNFGAPYLMQLKSVAAIRETLMAMDHEQDVSTMFMNVYRRKQYLDATKTDISILNEALRTASYLQFHHSLHKKGWVEPAIHSSEKLPDVQTLQVMTAKLARKQGNKKLAESLLAKQLSLLESKGAIDGKMYLTGGAQLKLKQLSASVTSGKLLDPLAAVDILKESAKLKRTLGNTAEAIDVLCSSILLSERQLHGTSKTTNDITKLTEVSARSFVTLAKWLLIEPKALASDTEDSVAISPKVREVLKAANKSGGLMMKLMQSMNSHVLSMNEADTVCGQVLYFSTYRCSSLPKTWFSFADWCYKWGRKTVEGGSCQIELVDEEKDQVIKILPASATAENIESVVSVLSKAHCIKGISGEEEICGSGDNENFEETDEEKIRRHLVLICPELLQGRDDILSALIGVWKRLVERLFAHYKQAAGAYFTFLKLSGTESFVPVDEATRCEYGNITATLRLLRLLVKYSGELKQQMELQLTQTPTKPWKGIIPQLLARLNHPEQYVQASVANLLCRIAKDSPHLIVYPTVVGCSDIMPQQQLSKSSAAGILRAYQFADNDELDQPEEQEIQDAVDSQVTNDGVSSQDETVIMSSEDRVMQSSLHTILDTLSEDNPSLVTEVKCVVQELRRITLLWDELWLGSLTQLHQEAQRRIAQLESEIKRVHSNHTLATAQKLVLIKEKHTALMKPLVYALERLDKITSQAPETPHEKTFQNLYSAQIKKAIAALKFPENPGTPEANWESVRQLYQELYQRSQKRQMTSLMMDEISPVLANSKFNCIPIPGVADISDDKLVTLESFCSEIHILPTKTKPKKLTMTGSDGKKYTYLFKGLEDLHLDERIMQFLEICNHMFAKEERSGQRKYLARHYSVTPLGPRSGLIQWVDGATPLFTLYRRWQQREIAAQSLVKSGQVDKGVVPVQAIPRPTELFYNKITPMLKEKGIDPSVSRKDWPLPILKKVLQELVNETPADLLARELWCSSVNASDWWCVTQTYSRSAAVMSVIGYVIGLGDRHLDNILVDLNSGEVVHIDYNVCFEKGKALRVPERVPFRMTSNLEAALGVTGVEGLFRSSCEKVMQILRQGRETLLTLLEAFVYDPLIDWTTANDAAFAGAFYGGGAPAADDGNKLSKKDMERGITQMLLSTRVAEMQVPWSSNRNELTTSLEKLQKLLDQYSEFLAQQHQSHDELLNLQHQASLLKAALLKPDHPLHTLQARYDKQAKLLADLKLVKQKITEKKLECQQLQKQFETAYCKVSGAHLSSLYAEVCKLADVGAPSYGPAASFLHNSGQSNIVSQCEQIEAELTAVLNQRRAALRACLDTIISYTAVVSQFSEEYVKYNSASRWSVWMEQLIGEPSSVKSRLVSQDHEEFIQRRRTLGKEIEPLVIALESKLHQYFSEQNSKLIKYCERRQLEPLETSSLSGPVTETWNALRKFIGDASIPGATSLACVTVTALSTLNKRQLVMENAASVAADRLMHLTSRDGDWFLDELCTMCGNIAQLLSVLKNNPLRSTQKNALNSDTLDNISTGMQVVFAAVKAYTSLQELMANFRTIIVPEAVKAFLSEDPSVLQITESLRQVITSSPLDVQTLCERYQDMFKERLELPKDTASVVNGLKIGLEQLTEPVFSGDNDDDSPENANMTPGQMLLAGFNGLFTKVDADLLSLYEAFRKMRPVDGVEHVDLQQDLKNLKLSKIVCGSANSQWLNFLFIKRLGVMHSFFEACLQQSAATRDIFLATKALNATSKEQIDAGSCEQMLRVFNEELLSLPVKQFIAECVQFCIVGIPSQALTSLSMNYVGLLAPTIAKDVREGKRGIMSLEDLCKKVVEHSIKSGAFPHQHLSQAGALINSHDVAWRKHDLARRLDASIAAQKELVQRAQLQLARFQWLYESFLVVGGKKRNQPFANPARSFIVGDIKKRLQSISQVEGQIPALMERYTQLQASIESRLKWASGANPNLSSVLKSYDQAVSERKSILQNEGKLTPEVRNLASSIVKLETFRSNGNEVSVHDQSMIAIVHSCTEACEAFESCTGDLGDVEQLMTSLQIPIPPKEPITLEWMKQRCDAIEKQVKVLKNKEASVKTFILAERETLKGQVSDVKSSLTSHHALVGEVKTMLKSLAKDEEAQECMHVRSFIQAHNKFSEDSSVMLKKIISLCSVSRSDMTDEVARLTEEDSRGTVKLIENLIENVNRLHDQLLSFGSNAKDDGGVDERSSVSKNLSSEVRRGSVAGDVLQKISEAGVETAMPCDAGEGVTSPEVVGTVLGKEVLKSPHLNSPPGTAGKILQPVSSPKKSSAANLVRDPKTGKALQERNMYAVNVWRRVKAKLEGRDLDANRRATVAEQVTCIIEEAINVENLCQLYEGWTPWV